MFGWEVKIIDEDEISKNSENKDKLEKIILGEKENVEEEIEKDK
jgi:hypothetical protein